MSNELTIQQKQGVGNAGTQIGVQNNYGLTMSDAVQMAFSIFKEYYPQLREEALFEVRKMVNEKMYNVLEENIVPPKPSIVVPTLQNASITEEHDLREMYANIIATSMDKLVKNNVHPGFVEIVKQITSDEAKVLKLVSQKGSVPTLSLRYEMNDRGGVTVIRDFSDIGEVAGCENPENISEYFDNLERLGLIINAEGMSSFTDKSRYEPLKQHRFILPYATEQKAKENGYDKTKFEESLVRISSYGKKFCSVCIKDI